MFITADELGLDDFLKAIQFIPPKGKSVEYFISPQEMDSPTPGYVKDNEPEYISDSIVYTRKDPATKISQQSTPADYANAKAPEVANSGPKPPVLPQTTSISSMKCPFIDVLSDNNLGTDLLLKENVGPFKKNTLFHCI